MDNKYFPKFELCLVFALFFFCFLAPACTIFLKSAAPIDRISPEETRAKVQTGKAILVCSYDDWKCNKRLLEGAILRSDFERRLGGLLKNQEIIFYCE